MKTDRVALAFPHRTLRIVVERDAWHPCATLESRNMPADKILHARVQIRARESCATRRALRRKPAATGGDNPAGGPSRTTDQPSASETSPAFHAETADSCTDRRGVSVRRRFQSCSSETAQRRDQLVEAFALALEGSVVACSAACNGASRLATSSTNSPLLTRAA